MLPTTLCQLQSTYFQKISLKKSGAKWGITLIDKVMRATLALWLQRNKIMHTQTGKGLKRMETTALYTLVEKEPSREVMGL